MQEVDQSAVESSHQSGSLPPTAIPMPTLRQMNWPQWRKEYFKEWHIVPATSQVLAICKLCEDESYHLGSKASFSNFLRHMKRHHQEEYRQTLVGETSSESKTQPPISSFVTSFSKPCSAARKKKLDRLFASMICKDNLPLTFGNREGFRRFMAVSI